jgi:hypothetical protein
MTEQEQQSKVAEQEARQVPMRVEETDEGVMARWDSSAAAISTNIDMTSSKGRAMMTRCLATADLKTRAAVGQVLEAVAFMAHPIEIEDKETGEITRKVRVVLVLKDGRTVSTSSRACVRAISVLARATQGGKWDPPIKIEVREFPLEGGRSYCDMREVPSEEGGKKK